LGFNIIMEKIRKFRLKELREERGLTQPELAEQIGVNYRTISNWERGVSEPDLESLRKLCDFFKVTAGYIIGTEDE